jgi:hypothetical protein
MTLARILIIIPLILWCSTLVKGNWGHESIGSVKYSYYYYEKGVLQGICVVSEEGVIAMLNPAEGEIIWRNYPAIGRRIIRFVAEGRCIVLLNS